MTQLRSVTCHMGSHSVTFYPTQVNTPRLHPSQTGWYSIYRPFKGGGSSKPRPRVQRATGPRLLRDSPEPARPEPTTQGSLVQHANHQAIANIWTNYYYIPIFHPAVDRPATCPKWLTVGVTVARKNRLPSQSHAVFMATCGALS